MFKKFTNKEIDKAWKKAVQNVEKKDFIKCPHCKRLFELEKKKDTDLKWNFYGVML
jgi:hypothetical protein